MTIDEHNPMLVQAAELIDDRPDQALVAALIGVAYEIHEIHEEIAARLEAIDDTLERQ